MEKRGYVSRHHSGARMNKKFDEKRIGQLFRQGMKLTHIAKELEISPDIVSAILEKNGLRERRKYRRIDDATSKQIVKRYREGADMRTIEQETGISTCGISKHLAKVGLQARRRGRRFKHIKKDRPDDELVRAMYLAGKTFRDIAETMKMTLTAVGNSLTRTGTPTRQVGRGPKKPPKKT